MAQQFNRHLASIVAILITGVVGVWVAGCPSRVRSPIDPTQRVTRAELNIQFSSTIARFEQADLSLDEQEAIRDFIVTSGLRVVQEGSINPMGLVTLAGGLYGLTRAGKDGVSAIKQAKARRNNTA